MNGDRLALARWEADRHAAVLSDALAEWDGLPAPSLEAIEGDRHLRQLTDQLLFRFMKLQDVIGERLVPATLGWLAEPFEPWPMRDRLDRLENSASSTWPIGCAGARPATASRTSTLMRRRCGMRRCWLRSRPRGRWCWPTGRGLQGCRCPAQRDAEHLATVAVASALPASHTPPPVAMVNARA